MAVRVDFIRIWLPASLVLHVCLLIGLQHVQFMHVSHATQSLIRIDITDPKLPMPPPPKAVPARQQPPRTAPERNQPTPRVQQPKAPTVAAAVAALPIRLPQALAAGTVRPMAPIDPGLPAPTPAAGPRPAPGAPMMAGGRSQDDSALPSMNAHAPSRQPEGWADRPGGAGGMGYGSFGETKLAPASSSGGTSSGGPMAIAGRATAVQPGGAATTVARGGGAYGGTNGGDFSSFGPGITLEREVGGLPAATPGVMRGQHGTWTDRPGGGGYGNAPLGKMVPGPVTTAYTGGGAGPTGAGGMVVAVRPGGASGAPERIATAPGGGPGGLFAPGGSGGGMLNRDIGAMPSSAPGTHSNRPGGWTDRPGGTGGTGFEGPALTPSRPSYGASTVTGPEPSYPMLAAEEGLHGVVVLAVTIDGSGGISKIAITQRSRSDVLDNEAIRTARRWAYRPAVRNGEAITSVIKLEVTFEIGKRPTMRQL